MNVETRISEMKQTFELRLTLTALNLLLSGQGVLAPGAQASHLVGEGRLRHRASVGGRGDTELPEFISVHFYDEAELPHGGWLTRPQLAAGQSGCLLVLSAAEEDAAVNAELHLVVNAQSLESVVRANPNARLELCARFASRSEYRLQGSTDDERDFPLLSKVDVAVQVPLIEGEGRAKATFDRRWRATVDAERFLDNHRYSQLSVAGEELLQSAGRARMSESQASTLGQHLSKVMELARSAFHPVRADERLSSLAFSSPRASFLKELRECIPQAERGALIEQYGRLWRHYPISWVIANGEDQFGPEKDGFPTEKAPLEEAASRLCHRPEVYSETLEWALVNALLYIECVAFARAVFTDSKLAGIVRGGSKLESLGAWARTLWAAQQIAWGGVKEGAALAVTALVGVAATEVSGDATAGWVVFTGLTVYRWARGLFLSYREPHIEQRLLLRDMAAVHQATADWRFNARAVRELLYRVAERGAVFSPWVYHLLDAKIAREVPPSLLR